MYIPKVGDIVELQENHRNSYGNGDWVGVHVKVLKIEMQCNGNFTNGNFTINSEIVKSNDNIRNYKTVGDREMVTCGPEKWLLKNVVGEWDD